MPGQLPTLDVYVAALWARRWRLIVSGLLGALIGGAIFFSRPYSYVSMSSIALTPQVTYVAQDATDNKATFVTLDTVAYLVRSDKVIEPVAAAMGVSVPEARRSVTVSAQPLSMVLRIHVRADTRKAAARGNQVATRALVAEQKRALKLQQSQIRLLRNRVGAIRTAAIGRSDTGADPSAVLADLDVMEERLQEAVASNRQQSLVIKRQDVMRNRPGQLEVFATAGLVAGVLLSGLGAWLARPPVGRRQEAASRAR
jgi:hypothetical protein